MHCISLLCFLYSKHNTKRTPRGPGACVDGYDDDRRLLLILIISLQELSVLRSAKRSEAPLSMMSSACVFPRGRRPNGTHRSRRSVCMGARVSSVGPPCRNKDDARRVGTAVRIIILEPLDFCSFRLHRGLKFKIRQRTCVLAIDLWALVGRKMSKYVTSVPPSTHPTHTIPLPYHTISFDKLNRFVEKMMDIMPAEDLANELFGVIHRNMDSERRERRKKELDRDFDTNDEALLER